MAEYLGYAIIALLALYGPALTMMSHVISREEPKPYIASKFGAVFFVIIICVGFYGLNDFILLLTLTPLGTSADSIFDQENNFLYTVAFFQTIGMLAYVQARINQDAKWDAKKFKELETKAQYQSIENIKQKEEAKLLKRRSEELEKEIENLKAANRRLDGHYGQLLTKNIELQEDLSFLEKSASSQTIDALERRREDRKNPWVFED